MPPLLAAVMPRRPCWRSCTAVSLPFPWSRLPPVWAPASHRQHRPPTPAPFFFKLRRFAPTALSKAQRKRIYVPRITRPILTTDHFRAHSANCCGIPAGCFPCIFQTATVTLLVPLRNSGQWQIGTPLNYVLRQVPPTPHPVVSD